MNIGHPPIKVKTSFSYKKFHKRQRDRKTNALKLKKHHFLANFANYSEKFSFLGTVTSIFTFLHFLQKRAKVY